MNRIIYIFSLATILLFAAKSSASPDGEYPTSQKRIKNARALMRNPYDWEVIAIGGDSIEFANWKTMEQLEHGDVDVWIMSVFKSAQIMPTSKSRFLSAMSQTRFRCRPSSGASQSAVVRTVLYSGSAMTGTALQNKDFEIDFRTAVPGSVGERENLEVCARILMTPQQIATASDLSRLGELSRLIVTQDIIITTSSETLFLPRLSNISGNISITNSPNLREINIPNLTAISGDLVVDNNEKLTSISLPALRTIGRSLKIEDLREIVSLEFPLRSAGNIEVVSNASLTEIVMPSLTRTLELFISQNQKLLVISTPNLKQDIAKTTIQGNPEIGTCIGSAVARVGDCAAIRLPVSATPPLP